MVTERITSRKNPLAVHIKKLGANRRYREEQGEFVCDGLKLLEDAVKSGVGISAVLTASALPLELPDSARLVLADRDIITSLSPLINAQDILFLCRKPITAAEFEISGTHILLDGIQDPGNLGTIIRTANALGIKSVILTGSCADPYNPKTIRASMGAIFRQSFYTMSISQLTDISAEGARFVAAMLSEDCSSILDVDLNASIIVIGSEGSGISDSVLALCKERIMIPIASECESLNAAAAAAIVIWEAMRKQNKGTF